MIVVVLCVRQLRILEKALNLPNGDRFLVGSSEKSRYRRLILFVPLIGMGNANKRGRLSLEYKRTKHRGRLLDMASIYLLTLLSLTLALFARTDAFQIDLTRIESRRTRLAKEGMVKHLTVL